MRISHSLAANRATTGAIIGAGRRWSDNIGNVWQLLWEF
jgi:hypothetical protein